MLAEALTALAAAGGTAVVQAAGTDAWTGFRARVAKWFARGDTGREQVALERLDRTAAALGAAGPQRSDRARWLWRAMSIFMPRRAALRPGRWATSRSASRLVGLPGRLVRRRALSSRAGPAADRPRHR